MIAVSLWPHGVRSGAISGTQLEIASGIPTNAQATSKKSPAVSSFKELTKPEPPKSVDCTAKPCIALTFDDGPNPVTTPKVLDILEREQVPASFFLVGSRIPGREMLLQRMYKDGDEIGNHSWTHPDLTKLPPEQIAQQVVLTQKAVKFAGVPEPTLFRPPYGAVDPVVRANVSLTFMFWNEDPKDWAAHTPAEVEAAVEAAARPGGVVDMHDIYETTVTALGPIIQHLRAQNFQFVTASQLLQIQPGQKGDFFGRQP